MHHSSSLENRNLGYARREHGPHRLKTSWSGMAALFIPERALRAEDDDQPFLGRRERAALASLIGLAELLGTFLHGSHLVRPCWVVLRGGRSEQRQQTKQSATL